VKGVPPGVVERARKYVARMDASVSGSRGHDRLFAAASALVHGFALDQESALQILRSEFNPRCDPPWSERELLHKVGQAAVHAGNKRRGHLIGDSPSNGAPPIMGSLPPAPEPPRKEKRPAYDARKLEDYAALCPFPISEEWLAGRSVIPIPKHQGIETAELMLSSIYEPDERVLVFTQEYSQGDFLWNKGRGSFRLAASPGVAAVASPLPAGGPVGVWFLAQPVTGQWCPNFASTGADGASKLGRRHGACVTAWRFMVIESDTAPMELWARALVQLPLPIVAIYTSGGKSVHALVRVNASSKQEWDALRDDLIPILCPLGADPCAITAVRLTRLPGTLRHGTRGRDGRIQAFPRAQPQRLLYLNPGASTRPILSPSF